MNKKYIIVSVGHTAAGKTTLLRNISESFKFPFVSEGSIKRSLVNDYQNSCSIDEELRSCGYKIAINNVIEMLTEFDKVVLDASFHKLFRRLWIYDMLSKAGMDSKVHVIWIYCKCPSRAKVQQRIHLREISKIKNADNQANKMFIYDYIMREFDEVYIEDFPTNYDSSIIAVDTNINEILYCKSSSNSILLTQLIEYINNNYFLLYKS